MTIRAAIYARTSPDCAMSADEQIGRLRAIAGERGWTAAGVFTDRPTSVRKGVDKRPGEMGLIEAIRNGTVDKVLIWSIDRIGRSLTDLVTFMEVCRTAGISLCLDEQAVDSAAPNGLPLPRRGGDVGIPCSPVAWDRILRGQSAARALSIRFGRPPISTAKIEKAKIALAAGKGVQQAARLAGISAASASRLKTALGTISVTA